MVRRSRFALLLLTLLVALPLTGASAFAASKQKAQSTKSASKKASKRAGKKASKKKGKSKKRGASARKGSAMPTMSKAFQRKYKVTPDSDPDDDGLSSYYEYLAGTNPRKADTNGDGVDDASEDRDGDRLTNGFEQETGTNPGKRDTNGNGVSDDREDRDGDKLNNYGEMRTGLDPVDRDTDDDGVKDGDENTGWVVDFDPIGGTLTVWLNNKRANATFTITEDSELGCSIGGSAGDDEGDDEGDSGDADSEDFESASVDDEYDEEMSDDCSAVMSAGAWFSDLEYYSDSETGELVLSAVALSEL